MAELILTFLLVGLLVLGMSVGVLAGRRPISGSCGGLAAGKSAGGCEICGGDTSRCEAVESGDSASPVSAKRN